MSSSSANSTCDNTKCRMLPPYAHKAFEDLLKGAEDPDHTMLPLEIGTYRIYCVAYKKRYILGLNDENDLVLMNADSSLFAKFSFVRSFRSLYCVGMCVNGNPINIAGRRVMCRSGNSLPDDWTVIQRKFPYFSQSIYTTDRDEKDLLQVRSVKHSWGVSDRDHGEQPYRVELVTESQCNRMVDLYFEPNDFPLTTGTYNIYCIGEDKKFRALASNEEEELALLGHNAPTSEFAKFTFTLHTQDDRGTFMNIFVNGFPTMPWEGDKIRINRLSCPGDSAYAWEVFRKHIEIYSIFTDITNSFRGFRDPIRKCWVEQTISDDRSIPLCFYGVGKYSTSAFLFIRPSVN